MLFSINSSVHFFLRFTGYFLNTHIEYLRIISYTTKDACSFHCGGPNCHIYKGKGKGKHGFV